MAYDKFAAVDSSTLLFPPTVRANLTGTGNAIINGAFDIWQRGTSGTTGGYVTADRWYQQANNSTTFTRDTGVPTGFQYSFKLAAGATAQMWADQVIETVNSLPYVNKSVTLSTYLYASASTSLTISIYTSTTVDNPASYANTNWTLLTSQAQTVGTSWGRYSVTGTIPSGAKTIMVKISTTSTVSSGVSFQFTGVQLEEGAVATTFRRNANSIQGELAACQRYFNAYVAGAGRSSATSSMEFTFTFPVTMRTAPTASLGISPSNSLYQYGLSATTATAVTGQYQATIGSIGVSFSTSGSGYTVGAPAAAQAGCVSLSSEL